MKRIVILLVSLGLFEHSIVSISEAGGGAPNSAAASSIRLSTQPTLRSHAEVPQWNLGKLESFTQNDDLSIHHCERPHDPKFLHSVVTSWYHSPHATERHRTVGSDLAEELNQRYESSDDDSDQEEVVNEAEEQSLEE